MNQTQQGMTGTGVPSLSVVVVGCGTHSLTQLTVSVGKVVKTGIMITGSVVVVVEVVDVPGKEGALPWK